MPTEKFYKLDKEKRQKIVESMKKEFSRVSFHEASINKIVEDAGISKGSFWVYFKSKEEAIEYLIKSHVEKEIKEAIKIFEKNNGDLFQSYLEIYDYLIKTITKKVDQKLMVNIFKNLITNGEKFVQKAPECNMMENAKNVINIHNLDIMDEDDLINIIKILNYIMRINLLDSITQKVTPECARKHFVRELEILKKGISKEK